MVTAQPLNKFRHLGVHFPESTGYADEALRSWLRGCGLTSGNGEAIAALKVYDKRGEWLRPVAPDIHAAISARQAAFMKDARGLSMRVMLHGCVWFKQRPGGGAKLDAETKRRLQVWARCFAEAANPRDILCGPLNEPEMGGWIGSEEDLLEVQAIVGKVWTDMDREWATVPPASLQNLLADAPKLHATLKAAGARPTHIAAHEYGQGSGAPRHVQDLKAGLEYVGLKLPVIFEEYGYGFPPYGAEFADRPDLWWASTGAYCADVALAIQRAGWFGCFFTLDQAIPQLNGAKLPEATITFFNSVRAGALTETPRSLPSVMDFRRKTHRLLTEHRGIIAEQMAKLTVRNLTYPE